MTGACVCAPCVRVHNARGPRTAYPLAPSIATETQARHRQILTTRFGLPLYWQALKRLGKHGYTTDIERMISLLKDSVKKGTNNRRYLEGASALARQHRERGREREPGTATHASLAIALTPTTLCLANRKMSAKLKAANCGKEAHTASEIAGCIFMALAEKGIVSRTRSHYSNLATQQ